MPTHKERRAQTRQNILKAAAKLFLKKGYEATTLAQILDEANIVKRTFYQHFQSKMDLLVILGRADGAESVRNLIKKVDDGMSPLDALLGYYQVMAQWFEANAKISEDVVISAIRLHDTKSNQPENNAHDFTKLMLKVAQQRGLIRNDFNVEQQTLLLGGGITLNIIHWSHEPEKNVLQQELTACIKIFFAGVKK